MKKILSLILLIALALILSGCASEDVMDDNSVQEDEDMMNDEVAQEESTPVDDLNQDVSSDVLQIELNALNFEYSQEEIRVKVGQTVKIVLTSTDGFHDFVVDELNIASSRINTGQTTEFTFTASEAGTFEYYCSVGSHRANGMIGSLIVEE